MGLDDLIEQVDGLLKQALGEMSAEQRFELVELVAPLGPQYVEMLGEFLIDVPPGSGV
jgi:hypothetical protein